MSTSVRTAMKLRPLCAVSQLPISLRHRRIAHASPNISTRMMNSRRYDMTTRRFVANCNFCIEEKQSKVLATEKLVEDSQDMTSRFCICGPL